WAAELVQRLGDPRRVLERVDTAVGLADMRLTSAYVDAHRDRTATGAPDDRRRGLGRHHRERSGIDELVVAEMPGAGVAARLLVADEVQHDAAVLEQPQLTGGDGAIEHAHEPALHVGAAAAGDRAARAHEPGQIAALHRDHVEVAVEVDRPGAAADRADHDTGILERSVRGDL